ncbi:MAG: hypothetical protein AB8C46_18250 [Burkholderiaceae bacterium]
MTELFSPGLKWEPPYTNGQDVPTDLQGLVQPVILKGLGNPVEQLFPGFHMALPRTVAQMQAKWESPLLVFKQVGSTWINRLIAPGETNWLVFEMNAMHLRAPDGPAFEEALGMLPPAWQAYYRWFDSFCVANTASVSPENPGTPYRVSARFGLDRLNLSKDALNSFLQTTGAAQANELTCWLKTKQGDTFWVNEHKRDQQVYRVIADQFEQAVALPNADESLDLYLEDYLRKIA